MAKRLSEWKSPDVWCVSIDLINTLRSVQGDWRCPDRIGHPGAGGDLFWHAIDGGDRNRHMGTNSRPAIRPLISWRRGRPARSERGLGPLLPVGPASICDVEPTAAPGDLAGAATMLWVGREAVAITCVAAGAEFGTRGG